MSRKPKHAPSRSSIPQAKEQPVLPRPLQGIVSGGKHPAWRLSLLDLEHDGRWSWNVTDAALRQIVAFLTQMERLTWTEIRAQLTGSRSGSHRKHHSIPLEALCSEAQRRLQELGLDEFDELFRFRLNNMTRLWGIVHDSVFYVLWWDPDHQVYPTDPN